MGEFRGNDCGCGGCGMGFLPILLLLCCCCGGGGGMFGGGCR